MKLLSIAVPCYNSEAYMRNCIESLLAGGEEVEIIIVDDGSTKDKTAEIADEYMEKYPTIVKAIHQENGGHGAAVNTGLRNATGLYYKVVDSDDWLNREAFLKVLSVLDRVTRGSETLDALICNYVYEKVGVKKKRVMRYPNAFPADRIFGWDEVKPLGKSKYVLMHSLIYRTELLRECGLELPEHTFYVDNLVAFQPMMYVKTMYYLDVNLYRYYIGREDQSVNEAVMLKRMDQQIRVNKLMIDAIESEKINQKQHRGYIIHYLSIIMTVSSILLLRAQTEESFQEKQELWKYLKTKDAVLYCKLRYGLLGRLVNLPGKGGRKVSVAGYKLAQRFYGFN
ncbi:MAG: glycosyltransferase [Lachnospiraceae bacterium]|nr:glycosyltransferase [Lachnospiraceae bacterium]